MLHYGWMALGDGQGTSDRSEWRAFRVAAWVGVCDVCRGAMVFFSVVAARRILCFCVRMRVVVT